MPSYWVLYYRFRRNGLSHCIKSLARYDEKTGQERTLTLAKRILESIKKDIGDAACKCSGNVPPITYYWTVPLILDYSYLVGKINKFENCWYKSVRILEVLKLLFQESLNLSSSQRDMSGTILGDLSNNRWSGVHHIFFHRVFFNFKCIL